MIITARSPISYDSGKKAQNDGGMHECKRDVLSSHRLGMRLYLFNKDETNETLKVEDMNQIFNQYRPAVKATLRTKLDPHA